MSLEKILLIVSYAGYAMSALFTLLGIPLVAKIVSPNSFYGVRTAETLQNTATWYSVNYTVGWGLILSGIISSLAIFLVSKFIKQPPETLIVINGVAPIVIPIVTIGITYFFFK
ncbi:SdpI family protein [Pseudoalteromonas piscicida]|uniref:Uncharacterized protein n=1 Tax=Pseudoalteromonas piscicida TaxID=43662 RepID=A0A2A5JSI6_PSEO7|nr:SdpI family protein [Pseudoalteromonas piscicida]PCK32423.1 hypothetical protein CEX98_07270 [Pseudoalteromonas piscicida]